MGRRVFSPAKSNSWGTMQKTSLSGLAGTLGRRSLAFQLVMIVLITAVPLIGASFLMYTSLVANDRTGLRQNLLLRAKAIAALIDNEIETHLAVAATLARSRELQNGNLRAFREQAELAVEIVPNAWLALSSPDGQQLVNTLTSQNDPLPKHIAPDVIARAFAEKSPQVSDLVFGPVAQRWTAFAESPVFRDGQPLYSLSITLPSASFLTLIRNNTSPGEIAGLIDRSKKFIARVPDHETRIGTLASDPFRAAMAQRPEGWFEGRTIEGTLSVTGYASTKYGWAVGIAQSEDDIARPLSPIFLTSALSALGLTALALGLAFIFGQFTNRGMTSLAEKARRLQAGESFVAPPALFAEAGLIGNTLEEVSKQLERRTEEIKEYQTTLEAKVADRTAELVTEVKRRSEAESTLRQTQKMESIGQLTGGIAHDFNNMLTVILGNLDTARRRINSMQNVETLTRPIEAAQLGARNAAKLTHRLLAFSRQQALEPEPLNLNALVSNISDMLSRTVGETIKLETVSGAGLWPIFADPNQVENSLVNLAINARDAMPSGGRLTIETANAYLDDAYVGRFGDVAAGQYVMLSVSDSGTGIEPTVLEKVFEPFFTTKEQGKGTGLGLSMIHGFARQSDGHIRIYSEVGIGTTVKIYLPRHIEPTSGDVNPRGEMVNAQAMPHAKAGETVLLVEDDPGVRAYAIDVLEDVGYKVVAASSGPEALQLISEALRIDILFTDVVLPEGLNGRELAKKVLAQREELPVLFTTGYTRNAIIHHGRVDADVNLVMKPYTQRDLARKIREVLDTNTGNNRRDVQPKEEREATMLSHYDPAITGVLTEAFDLAWNTMMQSEAAARLDGSAELVREAIAKRIVTMADEGLKEPQELAADALAYVTDMKFPEIGGDDTKSHK